MALSKDFLWGGAASAGQMEGAYIMDGKAPSIADVLTAGSADMPRRITDQVEENEFYPSHAGNDFYHRYESDLELMAEMGFKSYRTSIAWTRIFPTGIEEEPNEKGLEYYEKVFRKCQELGIEPIVTLSHLETPLYLAKTYNSWVSREMVDYFMKFCEVVFKRYKGLVHYWMTFNEINHTTPRNPQSIIFSYMSSGVRFDKMTNQKQAVADACYHMVLATAKAVNLAHKIDPANKVSIMNAFIPYYPETSKPEDVMATLKYMENDLFVLDTLCRGKYPDYKIKEYEREGVTLPMCPGDEEDLRDGVIDYIGYTYYNSYVCTADKDRMKSVGGGFYVGLGNPHLETTKWGWTIDPVGLRYSMNFLYDRYNLPIVISENGFGAYDTFENGKIYDDERIDFLQKHIEQMIIAIEEDGVDCFGYQMWTPIDLVSGTSGEMEKRYGLVYVDRDNEGNGTMERYRKKSFYWYKRMIATNGAELKNNIEY